MKLFKSKKTTRMFAMGMVTFFCLCANILATVAWFTSTRSVQNDNDYFAVENEGDANIESVKLYKFNYSETTYGSGDNEITVTNYLSPETGEVKKYDFNETEQKFGEIENGVFIPVTVMNIYDPIEKVIKQDSFSLLDLNCNAVYEITLSSTTFANCDLNVIANWISTKTKESNEIFLTDCLDFDLYFEEDLLETNPNFSSIDPETGDTITKMYYPSYISKNTSLNENENIYYKFAYLSSLKNSHPHFYGNLNKPSSVSLVNGTPVAKTFDANGKLKVYVNVNYAPNQLEKYQKDIYENNIIAVYDFSLSFQISSSGGNE